MNTKLLLQSATALTLSAFVGAPTAFAGGFQLNEQSAINTGRASSVVATVKDPSAIWHNPAGLTNTEGTEFQLGLNFIRPTGNYVGPGLASTNPNYPNPRNGDEGESIDKALKSVPNFFASRALSSKAYVGLGIYFPYGSGNLWEDGKNFSGRTIVQELVLRTLFITPAIALKLSDNVSVAVGVSLVPASAYLKRVLGASDGGQVLFPKSKYNKEGSVEITGAAFGVGANAGLQLTMMDHLKIGLAFRSAIDLAFSGDAKFDIPTDAPSGIAANFPDGEGSLDITLPHTFLFGIGWDDGPLTVEASTQVTMWSSYDELRVNFASGLPSPSSASPRNWNVVPMFRLGGQYMLTKEFTARAGLGYDVSPVPDTTLDPTLADSDRKFFTLGAGYDLGFMRADMAYMGLILGERKLENGVNINFPVLEQDQGLYKGGMAHVLSFSLSTRI